MTFQLELADPIQGYIFFFGVWEPVISKYLINVLRSGDIAIDIGANIGYVSLLAAKCVGPTGRVYAIEASPGIYGLLRRNVALNQMKQIVTHNVAATENCCTVPVYVTRKNLALTTILPDVAGDRADLEAVVPGLPLTRILNADDICRARLIKIDVEGAEELVVSGMREVIPKLSCGTEILLEVRKRGDGSSTWEMLEPFFKVGYRAFVIENEYGAEFYIRDPQPRLTPFNKFSVEQADIVLKR